MINVGIIGTGSIATSSHAPALRDVSGAQLWSVLSRDGERAAAFATEHEAHSRIPAHESLETFLDDPDLDAVIVTSPDKLHAQHAVACAKAGKHLLVEKPLTTDLGSARSVIEVCKSNDVVLAMGLHLRWHVGHRALHRLIHHERVLGDLRHVRVLWSSRAQDDSNWRASDELGRWWSLAGYGPHCVDLIGWMLGETFDKVAQRSAVSTSAVWGGPHDETAVISYAFKSGATAECTASFLFESSPRLEVYGTDDYAICEGTLGRFGGGTITFGKRDPLTFEPTVPFIGEIQDFVDAIVQQRRPEVDGADAFANLSELIALVS